MKILQVGVPRSGNYWVYYILRNIFKESEVQLSSYIEKQDIDLGDWQENYDRQKMVDALSVNPHTGIFSWRVSSVFSKLIVDLDCYLSQASHIWSHAPYIHYMDKILSDRDRVIYIVRDPRDVFVSQVYFHARKQSRGKIELDDELEGFIKQWE